MLNTAKKSANMILFLQQSYQFPGSGAWPRGKILAVKEILYHVSGRAGEGKRAEKFPFNFGNSAILQFSDHVHLGATQEPLLKCLRQGQSINDILFY